jgi:dihydroflavonol-4-reductase
MITMKVLVTGGTGFLGTNIVHALLDNDPPFQIRAFGLPKDNTKYVQHERVEIILGDVLNIEDVKRAVKDVDYVIHSAGDTSFWSKRFKLQRRINTEGVRNVMDAALQEGVKRVIHTATIDTIGINPDGLTDETWNKFTYKGTGNVYAESKREGEKIALSYVEKGLEVIVINPGSMIGPYDHTLQYGRLFGELLRGEVPGIPCGGVSWAHVTEVAKAHVTALNYGRVGERYICAGENVSYEEVFKEIAKVVGAKKIPKIVFPKWLLVIYGALCEFASFFTNKAPEVNIGHARYMSMFPQMDSTKAEKELGYRVIPVDMMIRDAYEWYKENGFL